jgi:hypothetical protein
MTHACDMLDAVFHEGARLWRQGQSSVSGQQKFYSFGKEWKGFKQQAHEAHQGFIFIIKWEVKENAD